MTEQLENQARIVNGEAGISQLQLDVATRIENPKRQAVLAELALKQLTELEQVVAEMKYEEVETTFEHLKPTQGTNGDGELRDIKTDEKETN